MQAPNLPSRRTHIIHSYIPFPDLCRLRACHHEQARRAPRVAHVRVPVVAEGCSPRAAGALARALRLEEPNDKEHFCVEAYMKWLWYEAKLMRFKCMNYTESGKRGKFEHGNRLKNRSCFDLRIRSCDSLRWCVEA